MWWLLLVLIVFFVAMTFLATVYDRYKERKNIIREYDINYRIDNGKEEDKK